MTMLTEDSAFSLIDKLGGVELSESDCYIIEAAYQKGFQIITDDACWLKVQERDLVAFVRMFKPDAYIKRGIDNPDQIPVIDMVLHCPACGTQHIDKADEFKRTPYTCTCAGPDECENCYYARIEWEEWKTAAWTNPPHRSHLCATCGHIWRPADVYTNGVEAAKTKGADDHPKFVPPIKGEIIPLAMSRTTTFLTKEPPEVKAARQDLCNLAVELKNEVGAQLVKDTVFKLSGGRKLYEILPKDFEQITAALKALRPVKPVGHERCAECPSHIKLCTPDFCKAYRAAAPVGKG